MCTAGTSTHILLGLLVEVGYHVAWLRLNQFYILIIGFVKQ